MKRIHVSCVMCHVSPVMCDMSPVMCDMSPVMCRLSFVTFCLSHVICHMSLMPTATATDPPPPSSKYSLIWLVTQCKEMPGNETELIHRTKPNWIHEPLGIFVMNQHGKLPTITIKVNSSQCHMC